MIHVSLHLMAELISLFARPRHFKCDAAVLYKTAITKERGRNVTTLERAKPAKR